MDISFIKLQEIVKDREAWGAAIHGVTKSWTRVTEQQAGKTFLPNSKVKSESKTRQKVKAI